jgi:hypothetical protein
MPVNDRLRHAMANARLDIEGIASKLAVDPKTVQRWLAGRTPRPRHRWDLASLLGVADETLWPGANASLAGDAPSSGRRGQARRSGLVELYTDRASVPREMWLRMLTEARERIDVLVYSGTFYAQTQPRVASMLADRARAGARVRLCFGQPSGTAVAVRDREEGLGGALAAKIRASLTYYRPLIEQDGIAMRLHDTTLYASIFRYDDEMVVNPHALGAPASLNPALRLLREDHGVVFDHYAEAFQRVWDTALPWSGEDV